MKQRLYFLDIIRGIASISVFITHLGNNITELSIFYVFVKFFHNVQYYFLWCNGGLHWAVIVFIVLSGFCIHMPSAKKNITNIIIPYYAPRRFFRIYPVLILGILMGYQVYSMNNTSHPSYLLNFIENITLLSGVCNYFAAPLGNVILITVIVECILYAIYPIILPKNQKQWGYLMLIAIFIYFLNFSLQLFIKIDPSWLQRNLFSLFLYWWIGAFFAEISFNDNFLNIKELGDKKVLPCIGILYIIYVVSCNYINFKGAHVFKSLFLAVMTGIFFYGMILLKNNDKSEESKIKEFSRFMAKIGEYSYSLYIIHIPVISIVSYCFIDSSFRDTASFYFINVFIVMICTILFYKFVEKPCHQYALKTSDKALRKYNNIK